MNQQFFSFFFKIVLRHTGKTVTLLQTNAPMSHTPFLIVPALVCLFWFFAHRLLASRTLSFRLLELLFLFIILSILGDTVLTPLLGSDAIAHVAVCFAVPTLIPMACLYLLYLYKPFTYKPRYLYWIILPFILTTAALILTTIMGFEETDAFLSRFHSRPFNLNQAANSHLNRLYYYWTILLFQIVLAAEFVYLAGFLLYLRRKIHFRPRQLYRFLFRGERIRVLEIQITVVIAIFLIILLKIVLHDEVFHNNPVWALSFVTIHSVLYFLFGFFALFGAEESISLHDIPTALRFNYRPETRSSVAEEIITDMAPYLSGESLTHVLSRLSTQHGAMSGHETGPGGKPGTGTSLSAAVLNVVSHAQDENGLAAQFRQLMRQERLYLQPGLTLGDVAERLGTNKTYVSKMVNQTYKMGFPEMLNILRVDYAQRYIRAHADASQEEIAQASGFLSASSFNSTFKRITGFTPKVWTARKDSISGR